MQLTNSNPCNHPTAMGTPCRRAAIRGGTRCTLHGGGSPEARRVAQEMLATARVPAARALLQIIEDYSQGACEVCHRGSDPNPVIRAAVAVLDRTGLHAVRSVQVEQAPDDGDVWIGWLTDAELEAHMAFSERYERDKARAIARMEAGEPRPSAMKVIEATAVSVSSAHSPGGQQQASLPERPKHV